MKNLSVDDPTYSMLVELSKKHLSKPAAVLERLVLMAYNEMKKTGRKVF